MDLKQDREEYAQQSIIRNPTPIMEAAQLYKKGEIDNAEKLLDNSLKWTLMIITVECCLLKFSMSNVLKMIRFANTHYCN